MWIRTGAEAISADPEKYRAAPATRPDSGHAVPELAWSEEACLRATLWSRLACGAPMLAAEDAPGHQDHFQSKRLDCMQSSSILESISISLFREGIGGGGLGRTRICDLYRVKVEKSITYRQPSMKTKDLAVCGLDAKLPPKASSGEFGHQTDSTGRPQGLASHVPRAHARGRYRFFHVVSRLWRRRQIWFPYT